MGLTSRKPRPLKRNGTIHRDAWLCVVATEDTYAPKQYLDLLRNKRVQVVVLPTTGGRSSPQHVLARMAEFFREYQIGEGDQLWLMCDTDRWTIGMLSKVAAETRQKHFRMAVSNPCFELWLLLHFQEVGDGRGLTTAKKVIAALRRHVGVYDKRAIDIEKYRPHVDEAMARASALDRGSRDRWPQKVGTHVYKLIQAIRHEGEEGGSSAPIRSMHQKRQ